MSAEEPQEDRKEAKRVTIAATGTQEGPTPSTEGHGGEAVPDRGQLTRGLRTYRCDDDVM